jgi:HNH endonuclease
LPKEVVAEVCHIFPYCLGKNMDQRQSLELWPVLEIFWGKEDTEKLKDIYGPPEFIQPGNKTLVNNLGNLVTLSKQAHGLWNVGSFALKHIRGGSFEGTKEMVLELEWLSEHPELTSERGPNLVHADQIARMWITMKLLLFLLWYLD